MNLIISFFDVSGSKVLGLDRFLYFIFGYKWGNFYGYNPFGSHRRVIYHNRKLIANDYSALFRRLISSKHTV